MGLTEFHPQCIHLFIELLVDKLESIGLFSVELEPKLEFLTGLGLLIVLLIWYVMLLLFNLVSEPSLGFDELLDLALEVLVVVVVLLLALFEERLLFVRLLLEQGDLLVFGVELVLDHLGSLAEDVVL